MRDEGQRRDETAAGAVSFEAAARAPRFFDLSKRCSITVQSLHGVYPGGRPRRAPGCQCGYNGRQQGCPRR